VEGGEKEGGNGERVGEGEKFTLMELVPVEEGVRKEERKGVGVAVVIGVTRSETDEVRVMEFK